MKEAGRTEGRRVSGQGRARDADPSGRCLWWTGPARVSFCGHHTHVPWLLLQACRPLPGSPSHPCRHATRSFQRTHFWLPGPAPSTCSQRQGHTRETKVGVRKKFPDKADPVLLPGTPPKSLPAASCPSLGQTYTPPTANYTPKTADTTEPTEQSPGNGWKASGSHRETGV